MGHLSIWIHTVWRVIMMAAWLTEIHITADGCRVWGQRRTFEGNGISVWMYCKTSYPVAQSKNKTPQYHGTVIGLEIHLSALKQMLSIWDNPSITKVRHCAGWSRDTVFEREKERHRKALAVKSAVLLVSFSVMENVFKMGSTGSHFTNH